MKSSDLPEWRRPEPAFDPLRAARGIIAGATIGVVLWAVVVVVLIAVLP